MLGLAVFNVISHSTLLMVSSLTMIHSKVDVLSLCSGAFPCGMFSIPFETSVFKVSSSDAHYSIVDFSGPDGNQWVSLTCVFSEDLPVDAPYAVRTVIVGHYVSTTLYYEDDDRYRSLPTHLYTGAVFNVSFFSVLSYWL